MYILFCALITYVGSVLVLHVVKRLYCLHVSSQYDQKVSPFQNTKSKTNIHYPEPFKEDFI